MKFKKNLKKGVKVLKKLIFKFNRIKSLYKSFKLKKKLKSKRKSV